MRYALTALALTLAYVVLVAVDPPDAAGVSVFYLMAVLILVTATHVAGGPRGRA